MNIKTAEFVISNSDFKKCPKPDIPEYAFIGRSNVGKSSLINMLTNRKSLAKTSSVPGKTQLVNHFIINDSWYLVDLPGYGWAKVSKTEKAKWEGMIRNYLLNRKNLCCLFVLIDSRLEPQPIDVDFIRWSGEQGIPLTLILTKCDKKLSKVKAAENLTALKKKLGENWETLPTIISTSATKVQGRDEILALIDSVNAAFQA
ncbi:MAG: ribosome biogenesis GTP-binding protein YihA/YsxC [Cyclobacteriaceae bacterium]